MSRATMILMLLWAPLGLACSKARVPQGDVPESRLIRISGSDTMLPLVRIWAEEYMRTQPGASVYVSGGGSSQGIRNLIDRKADVAAASRPIQAAEVKDLAARFGTVGRTVAVAKEALSVYLHPDNPVRDLSMSRLRAIFTGRIRSWRELGGEDRLIHVVRRSSASGTYLYFLEHVLEAQPYVANATVRSTTEEVVALVSSDPAAISYGGIAYGQDLHCSIEGVLPTEENVRNGSYPIRRYLHLVTVSRPPRHIHDFLDWVVGPAGQSLVAGAGYVSLW